MARLKKNQHKSLSSFVKQKKIIDYVNKYLSDNDMGDFEVESLQIRALVIDPLPGGRCPNGMHLEEYCTINGRCVKKCVSNT